MKMIGNGSPNFSRSILAVALSAVAFGAQAQLEEVVVTAQKRSASLQDVPIAVSAFSADELLNQGVSGAKALETMTPGLVYNLTGATAQPFLRGVGTRLAQNGLELSIATYSDDRYVARATASMIELADVERIEILKGPQGTLYGRNSTGGAIRIISAPVETEFGGTLKGSYGNYNAYTLSGSVNIPMGEDFGMRLTAMTKERDGFAENVNPAGRSDWDDLDYQAFRGKLRWDVSDSSTANLTLEYWQRDDLAGVENINVSDFPVTNNGALGSTLPQTRRKGKLASAIDDTNDGSEFSGQFRFDHAFESVDFAWITTWSDFELDWLGDADGGSMRHLDAFVIEESSGFSQEIQFLSNNDSNLNWIVGAYYFQDDADYELWIDLTDVGVPFASQSAQNTETESWAVFGQLNWLIGENTRLTVGGRYTEDDKEMEGRPSSLPFIVIPTFGAVTPIDLDDSWSEFTPSVTLDHNLSDDVMLYATYSRGFKSGGFNYPAVTNKPPNESALDPEILDMYELGMKGEFLDSTMRLNASLYYYDYTDLQVTRASGGAGAVVTTENAADATIMGLDVDMIWLATDNLTLTAGLNILDTEYEDYDASGKVPNFEGSGLPGAVITVGFSADGEQMLRAPEWSALLSAEYVIGMQSGTVPLFLSYSYKDDYDFDFVLDPGFKELTQDAYGLLSARISYLPNSGSWEVGIYGNNLTDEDYKDDSVGNGAGIRINRGHPRTYGVDFTYNF